jgi:hypothetical protein
MTGHLYLFGGTDLVYTEQSTEEQSKTKTKLGGFSPQANYTDRATTACRRS